MSFLSIDKGKLYITIKQVNATFLLKSSKKLITLDKFYTFMFMLKIFTYLFSLLLLLSCNNHFHQPLSSVKSQKTIIRNYINAEDSRDTFILKKYLANTLSNYWKMESPPQQKIVDFYKDYWTKNKFSKNTIKSITAIAKNTYSVKTAFEVQRIQADTALHFESIIIYKLNKHNKIVYVGKE